MTSVEQNKVTVAPTRLPIDIFVFTIDFFRAKLEVPPLSAKASIRAPCCVVLTGGMHDDFSLIQHSDNSKYDFCLFGLQLTCFAFNEPARLGIVQVLLEINQSFATFPFFLCKFLTDDRFLTSTQPWRLHIIILDPSAETLTVNVLTHHFGSTVCSSVKGGPDTSLPSKIPNHTHTREGVRTKVYHLVVTVCRVLVTPILVCRVHFKPILVWPVPVMRIVIWPVHVTIIPVWHVPFIPFSRLACSCYAYSCLACSCYAYSVLAFLCYACSLLAFFC